MTRSALVGGLVGALVVALLLTGFTFYHIGQRRGTDWCHCVIMGYVTTKDTGKQGAFRQQATRCDEQYPLR